MGALCKRDRTIEGTLVQKHSFEDEFFCTRFPSIVRSFLQKSSRVLCIIPSYSTLQHTATHCNTLQHTATHCNTLQHTATHCNTLSPAFCSSSDLDDMFTWWHCNTLQHTATHCNTLICLHDCSATHCNALQHTATHRNTLQHTATHCNTPQHIESRILLILWLWWYVLCIIPWGSSVRYVCMYIYMYIYICVYILYIYTCTCVLQHAATQRSFAKETRQGPFLWSYFLSYGVAPISRPLEITGLFCKRAL